MIFFSACVAPPVPLFVPSSLLSPSPLTPLTPLTPPLTPPLRGCTSNSNAAALAAAMANRSIPPFAAINDSFLSWFKILFKRVGFFLRFLRFLTFSETSFAIFFSSSVNATFKTNFCWISNCVLVKTTCFFLSFSFSAASCAFLASALILIFICLRSTLDIFLLCFVFKKSNNDGASAGGGCVFFFLFCLPLLPPPPTPPPPVVVALLLELLLEVLLPMRWSLAFCLPRFECATI